MFTHPLIFALPLCNVLFLKHLIWASSFSKYILWCLIWLFLLLAILSKENMFCHNILNRDLLFLSVSLDDFLVLPFGYFGGSYSYWAFLRCYRTWRFPICSSKDSLKTKHWDPSLPQTPLSSFMPEQALPALQGGNSSSGTGGTWMWIRLYLGLLHLLWRLFLNTVSCLLSELESTHFQCADQLLKSSPTKSKVLLKNK